MEKNDETFNNRLTNEFEYIHHENEKQMKLKDEIREKQLNDQAKTFERFREQIQQTSVIENERLKEHMKTMEITHKQVLQDLKLDYQKELSAKDDLIKKLELSIELLRKSHAKEVFSLRQKI